MSFLYDIADFCVNNCSLSVSLFLVLLTGTLYKLGFTSHHPTSKKCKSFKHLPLPPGPRGLPIFGHLFNLKPRVYLFLAKLMQYGPLVRINLFFVQCIVLNSAEAVRAAFSQEVLCSRPASKLADKVVRGSGIIFQNGQIWKTHRRLSIRILRDLGVGRSVIANAVERECMELYGYLSNNMNPVESESVFSTATSNVISGVVFGDRPGYGELNDKAKLIEKIRVATQNTSLVELMALTHIPYLEKFEQVFACIPKMRYIWECVEYTHDYVISRIKEHRKQPVISEQPPDFLHAYLLEQEKAISRGESNFDDWKVIRVVLEMFIAGADTSAAALTWGVLFMALNDEIRQKATSEVHRVIGHDKWITMEDKKSLPYIEALVDEIMRFAAITPYGAVPHTAEEEAEVMGFRIPKGTLLLTNQYGIFRDPNVWKHPNTFNPDNFLNEKGEYTSCDSLIPFSVGKRSCLGETLARMELFIFIAMLVQRFRFELVLKDGDTLNDVVLGTEGTICACGPHQIRFHKL